MPARVILKVTSGPIQGREFVFEEHDMFLFGRHSTCHARLRNDKLVSRHHFVLEANPPDVRLRDLGSLNGTYVNDVKHGGRAAEETPEEAAEVRRPEVDLRHGDRITVGKTTIEVRIELPLTCSRCGVEIPEERGELAELTDHGLACKSCSTVLAAKDAAPEEVRCERCGKDVAAEVSEGRRGRYLCQACRSSLLLERGGLRRLLQQTAQNIRLRIPSRIPGYELGEELGRGGMGVVYEATRESDGLPVAVKIMLAQVAVDEQSRKLFLREIAVAERLRHPNIVRLLASGAAGSVFYCVMEYCNGGALHELSKDQAGKLPLTVAGPLMVQCLKGLEHAHAQGCVHRDLKPQNILLHQHGDEWIAKISDFGLAKNFQKAGLSGMTATGAVAGTYHFMPREQLTDFKYAKPTADIWSIAATFYRLLTGHYPRDCPSDRDPVEVVLRDDAVKIQRRDPHLPASLAGVIDRALATDPADRYQSAAEMRTALESAL